MTVVYRASLSVAGGRTMNEIALQDNASENARTSSAELATAQRLVSRDRRRGLAALNDLFRSGTLPASPLDGRYRGSLAALDIAPGFTRLFDWITASWMPWLGKTFDAAKQTGENIFSRDSYLVARFFNPLYRGFALEDGETYRGFAFRTYTAPGLMDLDRTVLKIDYDLDENPPLNVRRVLDELVQVDRDTYLGKAHLYWWWGSWQTVAYFVLSR
jgi:hypothetical protein